MFGVDFYSTPPDLVKKMLAKVDFSEVKTALEPSAGKGDIAKELRTKIGYRKYHSSNDKIRVDVVEIDKNLRHVLKGESLNVVHDDFLNFETYKRYDLIVMNPPFYEGDKHLLQALKLMKHGGQIVCLLNAETIKNPYTLIRKDLMRQLDELGAEIEYIDGGFSGAERKTDVETALIYVRIPKAVDESVILENLRKSKPIEEVEHTTSGIIPNDRIKGLVTQYNAEIAAGVALINDFNAMLSQSLIRGTVNSDKDRIYSSDILTLSIQGGKSGSKPVNKYIESVRHKYWGILFGSKDITGKLTDNLREKLYSRIDEFMEYDFSYFNIYQLLEDLSKQTTKGIETTILNLFDEFIKYSMQDEKNVYLYNGWKTNSCYKVGKKVIVPWLKGWEETGRFISYRPTSYHTRNRLADIEKVFDFLDGQKAAELSMDKALQEAENQKLTAKIPTRHFNITFYKKGTCHLEFLDMDLLKKFNLFGSQRKNWLPPSYGKKSYKDLEPEEKAVVDAYEGKASYESTLKSSDYFFVKDGGLLMLGGGER